MSVCKQLEQGRRWWQPDWGEPQSFKGQTVLGSWLSPGCTWASSSPQSLSPCRQRCKLSLSGQRLHPALWSSPLPILCSLQTSLYQCQQGLPERSHQPSQSPNSVHGSRRGSISSVSSVSLALDEKDDDRIRCCTHCKDTLLKREQQIDGSSTPDVVRLYEVIPGWLESSSRGRALLLCARL